jgi:hypothetical protein
MGRAIWGYQIAGDRYSRRLVATDQCREYWPQVLTRLAQGDSLRKVAAWLDSEGVKTDSGLPWNEGTLGSLVKSPTYRGERKQQYPVIDCDEPLRGPVADVPDQVREGRGCPLLLPVRREGPTAQGLRQHGAAGGR